MNKNLKKVISTVAALAVSASSFVALAAQSFPDVAETATYAQAVDELVALGVVNGYTDGTFGPDKSVTRAEITKMIVVALGQGSTGESTKGQDTEFTDVPGTHWASGYVSVGTSTGFINGMGDGTFQPDSTVQYAQAVKMLVSACGYTSAATSAGGYPSGYMSIASQNSMLTGLSGVSNSTELNRGQVAQLIDNAMKMPLTLTTGSYSRDAWGNEYPDTDVYDGEGDDYQTLLTKYHDTYVVQGRVTGTHKTSPSAVEADEVQFRVEKADNFDGEYYDKEDSTPEIMKKGTTDAEELLFSYATALVQKDDDDEYTILSITASSKGKTVSLEADDYDEYTDDRLYFFTNAAQTKTAYYKTSDDVVLYVNGVEYGLSDGFEGGLAAYVDNNNVGTVTLIDQTEIGSGTTDGYYDVVMVTYYVDAIFDQVTTTSSTTKLQLSSVYVPDERVSNIEIDDDDDNKTYTFTLGGLDGEEIAYTDLQTDDVLSIAYDVNEGFNDSDFYDVYVSRNVVSGTISQKDTDNDDDTYIYTIDGTEYKASALGQQNGDDLEAGTEYTLYLNIFGKFADTEEGAGSVDDIAVVDSFYVTNAGTYKAVVIRADGKDYEYELKDQSGDQLTAFSKLVYKNSDGSYLADKCPDGKNDVQNRVAKIKVNSNSKISLVGIDVDEGDYGALSASGGEKQEYKSSSSRLGSLKIDDSTVLLDFQNYGDDDYGLMSKSSLTNETKYTAYGYSRNTSGVYRFVIVTKGDNDVNGESNIAVVISTSITSVDGDTTGGLRVSVNGDEDYILIDPDDYTEGMLSDYEEGTPFFYTVTGAGYIDTIYPVLEDKAVDAITSYNYTTFVNYAFGLDSFNDAVLDAYASFDDNDARVEFGPVVDKSGSMVQLAGDTKLYDGDKYSYMEDNDREFSLDSDTHVTSVALNAKSTNRTEAGTTSSIVNTVYSSSDKYDSVGGEQSKSGAYINWTSVLTDPTAVSFALVKEYDNDTTDVVVYTYE